jgi:D-3-phosphoglycerate dehydrogenase
VPEQPNDFSIKKMLPTIVTCFPVPDHLIQKIKHDVDGRFNVIASNQDQIATDLFEADIFCGHAKVPVDWKAVVDAKRLAWIQSSAAGLDHCLTPEVINSDIVVSGCSGLFAPQVAEQSMSLLMGLIRRAPVFFRAQQNKDYVRRQTDNIFGKSVLIIGFGGNGQRIARTLRPMVDQIKATDFFPESGQSLVQKGIVRSVKPADELDSILPEADIIIVTLPLSEMNEQLLSDDQFAQMKPGAYFVNVGRGSVVDTQAMIASLNKGRLAGAGIDVVDPEPLPHDSPLWEMDNVIISPHVGAQSPLRVPTTVDLFLENVSRFEKKQSLLNLVDKQLGFPRPEHRIPLN